MQPQQRKPGIIEVFCEFLLTLCDIWRTISPVIRIGVSLCITLLQEKGTKNATVNQSASGNGECRSDGRAEVGRRSSVDTPAPDSPQSVASNRPVYGVAGSRRQGEGGDSQTQG